MNGAIRLPDLPSELLRLAVADLKAIEKDPLYLVDMAEWHRPNEQKETCRVCLAGSVLARTLGHSPSEEVDWEKVDPDTSNKLTAIDDMRAGDLELALLAIDIHDADSLDAAGEIAKGFEPPRYDRTNPAPFHRAMEDLARKLEEAGL